MKKSIFYLLFANMSFQAYAETPIERHRKEEIKEAKQELDDSAEFLKEHFSRSCFDSVCTRDFFVDLFTFPIALIDTVYQKSKLTLLEFKHTIEKDKDEDVYASKIKNYKESMEKRSTKASALIGKRPMKPLDFLAFTLGFTIVNSLEFKEGLLLENGYKISEEDLHIFPFEAQETFEELMRAKKNIPYLPEEFHTEEGFMGELVSRMTGREPTAEEKARDEHKYVWDRTIQSLRKAAKSLDKTLQKIKKSAHSQQRSDS